MTSISNHFKLVAIAASALAITACGSDSSDENKVLLTCDVPLVPDAAGLMCVTPEPIFCPAPTVPDEKNESCIVGENKDLDDPVFMPGEMQAVLYYKRPGPADLSNYEGYTLHTWNEPGCDAYDSPFDATDWNNGHLPEAVDPNFGAYWVIPLKEGYEECAKFIIHNGPEKALGDGDMSMPLMQEHEKFVRANFTLHGEPSIFEFPILGLGFSVTGASAHWLDTNTLIWNQDDAGVTSFKLHYAVNGDLEVDPRTDEILNTQTVELMAKELTDEQKAIVPHLAGWNAYDVAVTAEQAKEIVKAQLVVTAYDDENAPMAATYVQAAKVLDDLYTKQDDDADEADLGVHYVDGAINATLWAPTAQDVKLKIYDAAKTELSTEDMSFDAHSGIWSFSGDMTLDRQYYRYQVTVYHPVSKQIEVLETTDPYSLNVSVNGRYSQFINLSDADLKPEGWDDHEVPAVGNLEDAVIYEGHVRDFSIRDESTSEVNRGKYLAFTEMDSAPVQHLKKLADNGLTHFHVLPVTDIATIDEDESKRIEITNTVGELCAKINDDADICKTEDSSAVIQDVLANALPSSDKAQAIVEAMRGLDGFNWGYDPHHFIAPEGSYASDSDSVSRVLELRAMNKALHDMGLRVVLDVVYNHTSASGLWDNSVLDKVVPGYYHRYNEVSGAIESSTCCDNTATEHRMMDKFVTDSLVILSKEYGYDGFRFDVMGHMPKQSILNAQAAVQAIDPSTHFYGEGWNFGEVADNRLFEQAVQANMAGTEIGTYNDRIREGVRSGNLFKLEADDAALVDQDTIRLSMAGNLKDYILTDYRGNSATGDKFTWNSQPTAYALDPADSINYVSKHDNETLWDNLQRQLDKGMSTEQRVRSQHIAATIPLLSQGIPFFQMGGDFLRSKSMDRNTYDSGDWFNWVDFTKSFNNWNVGLPRKADNGDKWTEIAEISSNSNSAVSASDIEFASNTFNEILSIRSTSPLFKLTTAEDVIARVGFHNIGKDQTQGVIVMSIDDGAELADLDPAVDAIVVMINGSANEVTHTVPTAQGFELHPTLVNSVDSIVQGASFSAGEGEGEGSFTVPAYTTAVFVKPQMATQGTGLLATATSGAPDVVPFGSTAVFVRGDMNGWGTDNQLTYVGGGDYKIALELTAGTEYGFKVADADWATVNFGGISGESLVEQDVVESLAAGGDNLSFTPTVDGSYMFVFNASDTQAPSLTVYNEEAFVGTNVYLRGDMNGWSTDNQLTYIAKGIYRADVTVEAGSKGFKVADADWASINFSSGDGVNAVTLNEPKLLGSDDGNLNFDFDETTEYSFVLDASNKAEPTLSIYKTKTYGAETIYIKGEMNGWSNDDPMTYQGSAVYSVDLALEAGDFQFKMADADWGDINFGALSADTVIGVDSATTLERGSQNNLTLSIAEAGNYRFTISGPNPEAPTITVEKIVE